MRSNTYPLVSSHISSWGYKKGPICLSGFVGRMLCTASTVQDYIMHQWRALSIVVHKGDLCPWEVGVTPDVVSLPVCVGLWDLSCALHVLQGYRTTLCTTDLRWWRFCTFVISFDRDGAQYDVVSLAVCMRVLNYLTNNNIIIHGHNNLTWPENSSY